MEKKSGKKRPQGATPRKEKGTTPAKRPAGSARKTLPVSDNEFITPGNIAGISLDAKTARQAIILSEIIGPPAAKRRSNRW